MIWLIGISDGWCVAMWNVIVDIVLPVLVIVTAVVLSYWIYLTINL